MVNIYYVKCKISSLSKWEEKKTHTQNVAIILSNDALSETDSSLSIVLFWREQRVEIFFNVKYRLTPNLHYQNERISIIYLSFNINFIVIWLYDSILSFFNKIFVFCKWFFLYSFKLYSYR